MAGLYPAEDTVTGIWKHESGITGSGSWCFVADESSVKDEIIITGEKGNIVMPSFTHGAVSLTTGEGVTEFKFENPEHISQNLVQQIVKKCAARENASAQNLAARTSRVLMKW